MVKHISKVIKETELYKQLQERKQRKSDMIQRALYQPVRGHVAQDISGFNGMMEKDYMVDKKEHKKSTEKPHSNE